MAHTWQLEIVVDDEDDEDAKNTAAEVAGCVLKEHGERISNFVDAWDGDRVDMVRVTGTEDDDGEKTVSVEIVTFGNPEDPDED